MGTLWERVARETVGEDYATAYADRFRRAAERGEDVHGEASLVAALVAAPARVLDAGCGTGRIAVRLHELGYDVVGCDVDASMIDVARREAPDLDWRVADLATLELHDTFDVVLVAGNVIPFLEPGSLAAAARSLALHLAPGGRLLCGFGLDAAHVPPGCPLVELVDVDDAMAAAGLEVGARWSTWDRQPWDEGGYVVVSYANGSGVG